MAVTRCTVSDVSNVSVVDLNSTLNTLLLALLLDRGRGLSSNLALDALLGVPLSPLSGLGLSSLCGVGGLTGLGIPSTALFGRQPFIAPFCR